MYPIILINYYIIISLQIIILIKNNRDPKFREVIEMGNCVQFDEIDMLMKFKEPSLNVELIRKDLFAKNISIITENTFYSLLIHGILKIEDYDLIIAEPDLDQK